MELTLNDFKQNHRCSGTGNPLSPGSQIALYGWPCRKQHQPYNHSHC